MNSARLTLGGLLLCIAAASGTDPGTPVPSSSSATTTAAPPASITPPPRTPVTTFVAKPPPLSRALDGLPWAGRPCHLLTDDTVYARQEMVTELLLGVDERTDYLAEASVFDQPGVVASKDKVSLGRCTAGVVLAHDQSLEVDLRDDGGSTDICDRALIVAEYAIRRIAA